MKQETTARGFDVVTFHDANGHECSLQQSSAIRSYPNSWDRPGSSCIWLGVDDAKPQILASDARRLGYGDEGNGWVPYHVPEGVLLTTRMHLDRDQAAMLRDLLTCWLETGAFGPVEEKHDDE
jgi:hypothetical protein